MIFKKSFDRWLDGEMAEETPEQKAEKIEPKQKGKEIDAVME